METTRSVEDRYADDGDSAFRNSWYRTRRDSPPLALPDPIPPALAAIGPDATDLYLVSLLGELCDWGRRPWAYHTDLATHVDHQELSHRAGLAGVPTPPMNPADVRRSIRKLEDCGLVRTDRVNNRPGKHRTIYHCLWLARAEEGGAS